MWRQRRKWSSSKTEFNPEDKSRVKHSQIGVWDLYEEIQPELDFVPGIGKLEQLHGIKQTLPYIWRMVKDVGRLKNCWTLLTVYAASTLIISLLPAVGLWYSGKLLQIVEHAVEHRTVDSALLIRIATARVIVAIMTRLARHVKARTTDPLDKRIRAYYATHIFEAYIRLDVPTFDDPLVRRRLESAWTGRSSVAWDALQLISNTISIVLSLISQVSVLIGVLREQHDGGLIAILSFISPALEWIQFQHYESQRVWAATCRNEDYIKLQGIKQLAAEAVHRKEIVAGNLAPRLKAETLRAQQGVGDAGGDFYELHRKYKFRDRLSSISLLSEPTKEIPQIVFVLRAIRYPASFPVSLASLHLIQSAVQNFSYTLLNLYHQFGSVSERLESIQKLYEIKNIRNKVVDGTESYPEDAQKTQAGICVEFRNVSFKYPGSDDYALRNVSFKVDRGQLCVIVGTNGSGKSTILKLIARLYDATEGEILIDGRLIQNLKLHDLRCAMAVLFQDYTHFPLSIQDNIALGAPDHDIDRDVILQAGELGGVNEFVNKLPDGFDTYLDRPVPDHYSGLPEGTKTLFGRTIDHGKVRKAGRMGAQESSRLSGGQMQRLAVSRTFMRTLGDDNHVGLLLFDEPSASLDPQAEHDLFERLRSLRGNKTMLFSSHRFGQLTRHADVIMYMENSVVKEVGTHNELLQRGGGYATIYNLQARAFMS